MDNKFHSLRLPIYIPFGKWAGSWKVQTHYAHGGEPYGFLHNDSVLYEAWVVKGSNTSGIFETQLDALIEMKSYYMIHNKLFGYQHELAEEIRACCSSDEDIKSETMNFK